jgi:hypothetical protein
MDRRNSNVSTKKVIALIAASMIIVAAISQVRADDNAPKPVDFSVSLDCRALEGNIKEPLYVSVRDYEQAYAKAKQDGDNWDEINKNPFYKGLIYDKSVRIAYDHGKVDDGAIGWLSATFVTEVTPEIIVIEGIPTPIGPLRCGEIDRRTGHADYWDYQLNTPPNNKAGDWDGVTKSLWTQYAAECEPSPPAKF